MSIIAENIIKKLKDNDASLNDLNLGGNSLGDEGAKVLAAALKNNNVLQSLELGNNAIGPNGAKALADVLIRNDKIETLYLRGNQIGDQGSEYLAQALIKNQTLKHLYLGGNKITIEGVKSFAQALQKNYTLETIYLRNNSVGDAGVEILVQALMKNFALRVINLANAELTEVGCRNLIKLLDINTTLQSIVFEHNGVENPEIIQAFEDKLKYNSSAVVITSNVIAKKILLHCEKYFEQEKAASGNGTENLDELAKKYALSRSEQYHWSGITQQGNSTLCVGFLSRMIFGRHQDQAIANEVVAVAKKLYAALFSRAKEEISNPKVAKPTQEILQDVNRVVD